MSGRVLFDGVGPKSQPIDAVKAMIEFFDGKACERLPGKVQLANGWQLTKSSKGDCYYTTSREACSCKGFQYRCRCKHIASLAGLEGKKALPEQELSPTQRFAADIVRAMEA